MPPAYRTGTRAKRRDDSRSLVFLAGDEPVLALTSGADRVDVERLAAVKGAPVRRASAEEARAATGFAIGGTVFRAGSQALAAAAGAEIADFADR
jgi:prolyl-tRNA editing enzyme YbaK/EbsC (Cys-tRNA(Pro) deacylase)